MNEHDDVTAAGRTGTWMYDGVVPCRVYLMHRNVWPGTGDVEDEPEVREDRDVVCVEVLYETPTGLPRIVGGGLHADVDSAAEHASKLLGASLVWDGTERAT